MTQDQIIKRQGQIIEALCRSLDRWCEAVDELLEAPASPRDLTHLAASLRQARQSIGHLREPLPPVDLDTDHS